VAKASGKVYVVTEPERIRGIYDSWPACAAAVKGVSGARYQAVGSREQAEDITAATFQRGLEDLPNFRWRGVPYSAWLYRVASNLLARDHRYPAWLELRDEALHDSGDTTSDEWLRQEQSAELQEAIRALPPDQRQAVLLRFFAGMRNKEVGKVMNRSEGAVKLLVFRAVNNLRKSLAEEVP